MTTKHDPAATEHDHHRPPPSTAAAPPAQRTAQPATLPAFVGDARLSGRANAPVRAATLQQMQQTIGNRAAQRLIQRQSAPAAPAPAAADAATAADPNYQNSYHRLAADITSAFEGGRTDSLQTADSGIVSYGKHQATLSSGSLGAVLQAYVGLATSATAQSLAAYLPRVQKKEAALRSDKTFLSLLRTAAGDPAMDQAQDAVFTSRYWTPMAAASAQQGIQSALGYAIFYDTNIQGGHEDVLARTRAKLGGGIGDKVKDQPITEQAFLQTYLEEREARLLRLSAAAAKKGKTADAKMLKASTYRTRELLALVNAGNLDGHGGPDGTLQVHGRSVTGLTEGATVNGEATPVQEMAVQRAPAPQTAPAAQTVPADIAGLNLLPKAQEGAMTLRREDPHVRFTSGRREMADQARAMAQNVVGGGGRNWIGATYAKGGPAQQLQKWVTEHPKARSQAEVQSGLLGIMQAMSPDELMGVSKHLSGEAFDVQPNSIDIKLIQALPGLTQFLPKEGKLVRWHIYIKE